MPAGRTAGRGGSPDDLVRVLEVGTGLGQVTVVVGDGTLGVPDHAPCHAIVVSAASPVVPAPLVEQLTPGGRLVHPVGPGGRDQP